MTMHLLCAIINHDPPYLLNVKNDDCLADQPTIADLLEYAAEWHHVDCGCGLNVGGRVCLRNSSTSQAPHGTLETVFGDPFPEETYLDALPGTAESSIIHLVISGEQCGSIDYLRRYREKVFVPRQVDKARVFKRVGANAALSPRVPTSYDKLCSIPGSAFVDKSRFLRTLLRELAPRRVGIMRRPKGFGKTTFLSMFDAFFDPLSRHAHLPFTFPVDDDATLPTLGLDIVCRVTYPIFKEHGQLLVYALDFADLEFERGMSDDEMKAECDRVMNAAAHKFYLRYRSLLHVPEEETSLPGFTATFLDIIGWAKRQGWKLCFTIDNYMAPVRDGPNHLFEWSISRNILGRLCHHPSSYCIRYGLILGDDVPHATKWQGMPTTFKDLTDDPELAQAIGFTVDEIAALGQAASADLIGALPFGTPTGRYARRVYAAADIMALARGVTDADGSHEPAPTKVRTFKHRPPVDPTKQSTKSTNSVIAKPAPAIPMKLWGFEPSRPGKDDGDGDGLIFFVVEPRSRCLTTDGHGGTARVCKHPQAVKVKARLDSAATTRSRKRARLESEETRGNVPVNLSEDFDHGDGSGASDHAGSGSNDNGLHASGASSSGSSDSFCPDVCSFPPSSRDAKTGIPLSLTG